MRFSKFAKSTLGLLPLFGVLAGPAHAQNNKQIISGTWYEDRAEGFGGNIDALYLRFAQAPTDRFLNITQVNCSISSYNYQVLADVVLHAGTHSGYTDLGRAQSVRRSASTVTAAYNYYSVVTQTFYKMGPGRFPTIEILAPGTINGNTTITASCVIVGNLSDT